MNRADAHRALTSAIRDVAPNADPSAIDPDADLMEELDLDSIDLVSVITRLHETTGVDIPERDYASLFSLDSFVAYLAGREEAPR